MKRSITVRQPSQGRACAAAPPRYPSEHLAQDESLHSPARLEFYPALSGLILLKNIFAAVRCPSSVPSTIASATAEALAKEDSMFSPPALPRYRRLLLFNSLSAFRVPRSAFRKITERTHFAILNYPITITVYSCCVQNHHKKRTHFFGATTRRWDQTSQDESR